MEGSVWLATFKVEASGASLSASQTIPDFTQTATAAVIASASASQTIGDFGQSASAAVTVKANASQTIPDFTQTATAAVIASASASQAIADFSQSVTIVTNDMRSLSASQTIPEFTQTVTAAVIVKANASQTIADFGQAANAAAIITANAAQTIADFTQTVTITVSSTRSLAANQAIPDFSQTVTLDNLAPEGRLHQAIKEAYASAPAGIIVIHTLEFRHPNFVDEFNNPTAIRAVLGHKQLEAKLEADAPQNPGQYVIFIPMAFELSLPNVEHLAMPEIGISIDNVSRDIEDNLTIAAASPYPVEVTYRPYLNTDLTQPQMNPPLTMTLISAEADDFKVTARAIYGNAANVLVPRETYNTARFPGIQR